MSHKPAMFIGVTALSLALAASAFVRPAEAAQPQIKAAQPSEINPKIKAPLRLRKPDLVIRSFGLRRWGPCRPGSAVMTFQVTIANVGDAPSPGSAALGNKALVQVMENSGAGPWGNGAFVGPIPPGGSATVMVPVYYLQANPGHMTADAPHKFSAVADPLKLVAEKNEYNNRSAPIKTAAPRGCPGGVRPPPRCKPGRPKLAYNGSEPYTTGGGGIRHKLRVVNWKSFCPEMFKPAPNLPPCGSNTNSSRTWVDILNANTNQRIYGFCALNSPQGLTRLWFAVPRGRPKPPAVRIVIRDRQTGGSYASNPVPIP